MFNKSKKGSWGGDIPLYQKKKKDSWGDIPIFNKSKKGSWGGDIPLPAYQKNNNPRKNISRGDKIKIWTRTFGVAEEGNCPRCGQTIDLNSFVIGHIKPHSKGGKETVDNLKPICKKCNDEMYDKHWLDFERERESIEEIVTVKKKPSERIIIVPKKKKKKKV